MDSAKLDCIVLDLDGTLVYSTENKDPGAINIKFHDIYGNSRQLWVHKRPGFDEFLKACFKFTTVGVWSTGQPGYVNAVVSLFPQKPAFVYNWFNCDSDGIKQIKTLNNIPHKGNILMIDDRVDILELCDRVKIFIVSEWHPRDAQDTVLYDLTTKLFDL